MIQEEELCKLLAAGEADRIERTTSTKDTDKFSEAVTAFANDLPNSRLPGYLVIGVKDDGTPSGLEVTDHLLRNLGGRNSGDGAKRGENCVRKVRTRTCLHLPAICARRDMW